MTTPYDKAIADIIKTEPPDRYDEVIRNREERAFFLQLSSLRHGVWCWYPFRSSWHCLEIGAGFGSLTGTLLQVMERTEAVEPDSLKREALRRRYQGDTLKVYEEMPESGNYDCIVLSEIPSGTGSLSALFTKAAELLKDDGVLLAVLPYCRGTDYGKETEKAAFSAGFPERFCYYLLPDMLFPQAVFSEKRLPAEDSDRFFFYNAFSDRTRAEREAAFRAALREGTFEDRASSRLVEYRKKPSAAPRVISAFLSCDRGRKHSFAIRFFDNGTVEKLPVYPEGMHALREMYQNLEELKKRGLRTVAQTITDAGIRMPFVDRPALLWYLKEHPDKAEGIFEQLYRNILKSSEASEDGRMLRKGYTDMIPFNCFYDGGSLIYYDQEFSEDCCLPAYIMFRAVYYTYLHLPGLEEYLPQERLKEKYGLKESWEAFKDREEAFVRENRNQELYYRFWE